MCIIAIKQAGQNPLSATVIGNCWQANPHGAGFAIHRPGNDNILIRKGFMTLESLHAALDAASVTPEDTVVYHFRIATSGGVSPENCHPFPVSPRPQDVKALEIQCSRAFIHNGIIGQGSRKFSDTQLYVLGTLSQLDDIGANLERIKTDTQGSRTVTIEADGRMYITGTGWVEDGGYLFSNNGFRDFEEEWDDFDFPLMFGRLGKGWGKGWGSEEGEDGDSPTSCGVCGGILFTLDDGALVCGGCGEMYLQCDNCGMWESVDSGDIVEHVDENGVAWSLCWYCMRDDGSDRVQGHSERLAYA